MGSFSKIRGKRIMKFIKAILEMEKYESLDIIAASNDGEQGTTQAPAETTKYDPYDSDKW